MDKINNIAEISSLCIICLTKTEKVIDIGDFLFDDQKYILIKTIIERIMSTNIQNYYPKVICLNCLGSLKVSLKLKQQFEKSTELLKHWLKTHQFSSILEQDKEKKSPPVEVIVGSKKVNLKDILIVEKDEEDNADYSGFLNNLGRNISVDYANKKLTTPQLISSDNIDLDQFILLYGKPLSMMESKNRKLITTNRSQVHKYILENGKPISNSGYYSKENSGSKSVELEIDTAKSNSLSINNLTENTKSENFRKSYVCKTCEKVYYLKPRYLRHIKECKYTSIYSCTICLKKFKEMKRLNFHVSNVHNSVSYPCPICKEVFQTKNKYSYHRMTKHSEERHICDICGKILLTFGSFSKHRLLHTQKNTTQTICPVCGKTFHYTGALFYHMKVHKKEHNYNCNFCDRKFLTHSAKMRHTFTHTGERPYACKFCTKRFFSSPELKKHEYIHTGHRPVRCEYCHRGFISRFNYKVHLFSHSGSYKCLYCERGFITQEVLRFHCKMKHKEEDETNL